MSMHSNGHSTGEQDEIASRLLQDAGSIRLHYERIHRLEDSLAQLESRFGIPSDSVHDAIDRGQLTETAEICDWLMDYELLQKLKQ